MAVRLGLNRQQRRWLRANYTPGQRMVLRHIAGEARQRVRAPGSPGGRRIVRSEKRLAKSGFETSRVESTHRNLNYGHADSRGWRQERAMYYDDPNNVPASVGRYFDEATPFARRGLSAHAIAQGAQQSAFPGRYATAEAEATKLFQNLVKGGGKGGGHGGGGAPARASGAPESFKQLIHGGPQATPVAGSSPPDPAISGRAYLKLPDMAGDVPVSGAPGPRDTGQLGSLSALLRSLPTTGPVPAPGTQWTPAGRGGIQFTPGTRRQPLPLNPARFQVGKSGRTAVLRRGRKEGELVVWKGGRWRFARGGKPVKNLKWRPQGGMHAPEGAMFNAPMGGTTGAPIDRAGVATAPIVRRFTKRLAGSLGSPIQFGTGTAHSQMTASGNVSDHWGGRAIDLPATGTRLKHMGAHALRLVGVSRPRARQMAAQGGIYNINYKGHRFQIIVRTADHWDHLHVGIQ